MSRIPDFTKVEYGVRPLTSTAAAPDANAGARGLTPLTTGLTPSDAWLTPEGIAVKRAYTAADGRQA